MNQVRTVLPPLPAVLRVRVGAEVQFGGLGAVLIRAWPLERAADVIDLLLLLCTLVRPLIGLLLKQGGAGAASEAGRVKGGGGARAKPGRKRRRATCRCGGAVLRWQHRAAAFQPVIPEQRRHPLCGEEAREQSWRLLLWQACAAHTCRIDCRQRQQPCTDSEI